MHASQFFLLTSGASLAAAQTATITNAPNTAGFLLPASTDASSYLNSVFSGSAPPWATGRYSNQLASALYSLDYSFCARADYSTIVSAIYSAVEAAGSSVSSSLGNAAWDWNTITTNSWYSTAVPTSVQTVVSSYNSASSSASNSVHQAQETGGSSSAAGVLLMDRSVAGAALAAGAVAGLAGLL